MGVRFPSVVSNVIQNTVLVTTAETVVAISPPFSPPLDSAVIIVLANVVIQAGTGSGNSSLRLRRGTTTAGALLNVGAAPMATSTVFPLSGSVFYFDIAPSAAGQQYCLTALQGGASGNGAVSDAFIMVFAL